MHPIFSPCFQAALNPLCNLSVDDALDLLRLTESHVDWAQIQGELEEFSDIVGGNRMNASNYRELFLASEDVRRDVLEKPSVKKVREKICVGNVRRSIFF